jgi:transposase
VGVYDPRLHHNLTVAFAASREKKRIQMDQVSRQNRPVTVVCEENLTFLPIAIVVHFFRLFHLHEFLNELTRSSVRTAQLSKVIEALVAHRCVDPGSKWKFQSWIKGTAISEVIGIPNRLLNNTRVHRAMSELAEIDDRLQGKICNQIIGKGVPRIIYLDLTDTWFEAGGGSLSRRGQTKAGHRSKRKIHIALMVNEDGLPMKWELLPGALNETTILPRWLPYLCHHKEMKLSVLIFDRGLPSAENFKQLVSQETGHLFLTSVKSDSIPTYVKLDDKSLDRLQGLSGMVLPEKITKLSGALGLTHFKDETYVRDLGIIFPPKPRTQRQTQPPRMRMYLYFNREIQLTKRNNRREKIRQVYEHIASLNKELKEIHRSRELGSTERKIYRVIEKLALTELFAIRIAPIQVQGKNKKLSSFQISITIRRNMYRNMRRFDGISLLVGHPDLQLSLEEAITAYRQKDIIEADFKTIKSVLDIRPTFHWTDEKIKSHVTICVLGLLVNRLIEKALRSSIKKNDFSPKTAKSLLVQMNGIKLNRLGINDKIHLIRTKEGPNERKILKSIQADYLLESHKTSVTIKNDL